MSDLTNLPLMGAETRIIQPPTPIQTDAGFFRNVGDNIANSWWFQQGASILQTNIPADPDFNPVDPELLKGKEEYIRYLQEARSLDHHNAIYDRIKAYEERRSRLAEEGGWGSALVGGLVDPANFIGLGVGRGVGIARGLLTGAATGEASCTHGNQRDLYSRCFWVRCWRFVWWLCWPQSSVQYLAQRPIRYSC